jgi:hypothetical protein
MKKSKKLRYALYPRLCATVGAGFLEESDISLLDRLASDTAPRDGTLSGIIRPAVGRVNNSEYLVRETCCNYDNATREALLAEWAKEGASLELIALLEAAQRQLCPQILILEEGMFVEQRKLTSMHKVGKRGLGRKASRKLLRDLREIYKNNWPIEQLAATVNSYLGKNKKGMGRKKW